MTALLRAESLAFTYPQNDRAIGPFSLQVTAGENVHIGGPSGCGKSTLARCLAGLIPHLYHGQLEGAVWLGDHRTDRTPLWALSEVTGLVFQNPASQILASTVEGEIIFGLENLGLPAAEIDMRLERALEGFDLGAMRLRSPHSLSGGEQQKLALAAITARQPPLLILDEPLSMLDVSASADFVAHLGAQAANGVAAVICEHRHEALLGLPGLRLAPMDGCINEIPAPDDEFEPASLGNACDCRLEGQGLTIMRGARPVLQGLDCSFQGGEITALVGRNGVGKTTLLKALAGLQPYQGELEARRDGRKEKPDLGIVFQNPDLQLFNPSARQEMLYGIAQPDQGLYTGLIQALDLERYQDTPPLLLSEGEKRRLALGTALMRCPRHGILLDEPALGQDEAHKAMLMRLLHQVARTGQVVVLATHDIDLARRADRLVLLGKEGFVASGPPDQVLSDIAAWEKLGLRLPSWLKPAVPLKHRVTLVERSTDVEH